MLTVDEIRKLRDEATQPPWTIDEVWQDVVAADGQLIVAQCEILADAKLIAAAPDLADTAIAALDELGELREAYKILQQINTDLGKTEANSE